MNLHPQNYTFIPCFTAAKVSGPALINFIWAAFVRLLVSRTKDSSSGHLSGAWHGIEGLAPMFSVASEIMISFRIAHCRLLLSWGYWCSCIQVILACKTTLHMQVRVSRLSRPVSYNVVRRRCMRDCSWSVLQHQSDHVKPKRMLINYVSQYVSLATKTQIGWSIMDHFAGKRFLFCEFQNLILQFWARIWIFRVK